MVPPNRPPRARGLLTSELRMGGEFWTDGYYIATMRQTSHRTVHTEPGTRERYSEASTLYSRLNQRTSIINAPALCAGSVFLRRTILPCIGLNDGLPLFVTSTRPGRLYAICGFEARSRKPIERQGVPSGAQAHVENSVLSSRDFLRYATPARRARWTTEVLLRQRPPTFLAVPVRRSSFMGVFLLRFGLSTDTTDVGSSASDAK